MLQISEKLGLKNEIYLFEQTFDATVDGVVGTDVVMMDLRNVNELMLLK